MVVLSKPSALPADQLTLTEPCKQEAAATTFFTKIPVVDLSNNLSHSKTQVVKACKEFGFFKVTNHGVPKELISRLESESLNFFSSSLPNKEKSGPPNPFGYGNKKIGPNGDMGWIEYLLLGTNNPDHQRSLACFKDNTQGLFWSAVSEYVSAVKALACEVLELLAEGLEQIKDKDVFSKILMDEESDGVFRLNHYPPCLENHRETADHLNGGGESRIGFGEHTDPQLISVLRSNNIEGLQIHVKDEGWVSVPPDENSFFVLVGDCLQVMSNGRFRSLRHRVVANSLKPRISMIYFGAPALREKITPLPALMEEGEESLYKEFTWLEYKKSVYQSRLADNRLAPFEKYAINC